MTDRPPDRSELVGADPLMLDEEEVLKNFLGKDRDAAQRLIESSPSVYEDFFYMAPAGLRYYVPAAFAGLKSGRVRDGFDFPQGLLSALSFQVLHNNLPRDIIELIGEVADYVDANRPKFRLEPHEAAGGLDEYLERIRTALGR